MVTLELAEIIDGDSLNRRFLQTVGASSPFRLKQKLSLAHHYPVIILSTQIRIN